MEDHGVICESGDSYISPDVNTIANNLVDFVQATDRLMAAGITLQEMAEALGVAHNTVRVARLDPASPSYRRPPAEWRPVLVRLARTRGGELLKIADKIENA